MLEYGKELKGYVTEQEWEDIHITDGKWVTSDYYLYSENSNRWIKKNLSETDGFPAHSYIFYQDGTVNKSTPPQKWQFNNSDSTLIIGSISYKVIGVEADKLYLYVTDDHGATPMIQTFVRHKL